MVPAEMKDFYRRTGCLIKRGTAALVSSEARTIDEVGEFSALGVGEFSVVKTTAPL